VNMSRTASAAAASSRVPAGAAPTMRPPAGVVSDLGSVGMGYAFDKYRIALIA
jgi:hypothetical protein